MSKTTKKTPQILKGFRDILPEHQVYWDFFMSEAVKLLTSYGFQRLDLPILEATSLYVKGTGKYTDIVTKELYSFEDKGGESVALRPEFTPGICRSYLEHGMLNRPQPVKLYSYGPVFRHDNPQSGRYRQFNQLNLEAIGSESAAIDVELIIFCCQLLEALGLPALVHINSIGEIESRAEFIAKLRQYLAAGNRKKELCENCKIRHTKNLLRILDCKEASCQEVLEDAPQIVDFLDEDSKKHFMQVLEYLDDLGIRYNLDVKLVRGLDYYNRTTFEIYAAESEINQAQSALAGGGRYDGLIEIYSGKAVPAAGVAFGVERIINKIRELKMQLPGTQQVDVFVAQLGVEARKEAFKLFNRLIKEGVCVGQAFSKDGLKNQLERADASGAKFSLILGQKELMDKTIIIRDMQSGIQEIANYDKIITEVKKRVDSATTAVKSYRIKGVRPSEGEVELKAVQAPKKNKARSAEEGFNFDAEGKDGEGGGVLNEF